MTFGADLNRFATKLDKKSNRFQRKVAIAAKSGVQISSPVDTGAFRQDWGVTVDSPDNPTITINTENLAKAKDIFIRNTKDYAGKLEHGHSDQAPHGIVRPVSKSIQILINTGVFNDR